MRLTPSNIGFCVRVCMASWIMICLFHVRVFPTIGSQDSLAGIMVQKTAGNADINRQHHEYVLLHTDRDMYVAGEVLYFKVSLISREDEENLKSGIFYLVMRNQTGPVVSSSYKFDGIHADGIIYLHDTLPSGYYELLTYTNWMRSMGEDTFFCKTIFIANRFDNAIKSGWSVFASNDAAPDGPALIMAPDSRAGHDFTVNRKPAVFRNEVDGGSQTMDVIIEHPQHAAKREKLSLSLTLNGVDNDKALVSISVSQRETIASVSAACLPASFPEPFDEGLYAGMRTHFMETDAYILSGQVTDKRTSMPLGDATMVLSTPDSLVNMMYVKSGKDGIFHFAIPPAYSNRDLFFSVYTPEIDIAPVISFWDKFALTRPFNPVMFLNETALEQLAKSQDLVRAKIAYGAEEIQIKEIEPEVAGTPEPLYAKPVQLVSPGEYTFFEDLQEISREIVPFWRIRRSGNTYRSSLVCAETRLVLPAAPVYFLDGIIVYDINPLIYLNSAMIDRIEMHNLHWVFGAVELPGIVAIFTKTAEYLRILPDLPYASAHHVIFPHTTTVHAGTSHENKEINPAAPDLRQVLYWNPQVVLQAGKSTEISFFSGDLSGDYVVRVEGISPDGSAVHATATISIR